MDSWGNYTALVSDPGVVALQYERAYVDPATGDVYALINGTWTVVSVNGGGGGSGTVTSSAVDPTGTLTITGKGICFGTGAVDGLVWKKTSAGAASDWVQM